MATGSHIRSPATSTSTCEEFEELRALVPEALRDGPGAAARRCSSARREGPAHDGRRARTASEPGAARRTGRGFSKAWQNRALADRPDASTSIDSVSGRRIRKLHGKDGEDGGARSGGGERSPGGGLPRAPKEGQGAPLPARVVRCAAARPGVSSSPMIRVLKGLQDVLGRHQDREVQIQTLRRNSAPSSRARPAARGADGDRRADRAARVATPSRRPRRVRGGFGRVRVRTSSASSSRRRSPDGATQTGQTTPHGSSRPTTSRAASGRPPPRSTSPISRPRRATRRCCGTSTRRGRAPTCSACTRRSRVAPVSCCGSAPTPATTSRGPTTTTSTCFRPTSPTGISTSRSTHFKRPTRRLARVLEPLRGRLRLHLPGLSAEHLAGVGERVRGGRRPARARDPGDAVLADVRATRGAGRARQGRHGGRDVDPRVLLDGRRPPVAPPAR